MQKEYINRLEAFDRLTDLLEDHPIAPAIPRVTALETQMGTVATTLRTHAAAQVGGNLLGRSGATSRKEVARELKVLMQPINRIARALDREAHPGVRDQFRMPAIQRYETLISTARAFVTALTVASVKTLFTDRGLAATFDTALSDKVDELVAITEVKNSGLATKVGGTQGMATLAGTGLKVMRELEAILKVVWADNPVLLASLKSACHVARPVPKDDEEEAPAAPQQPLAAADAPGGTPEVAMA